MLWMLQRIYSSKVTAHTETILERKLIQARDVRETSSPVTSKNKSLQTKVAAHAAEALKRAITHQEGCAEQKDSHQTSKKNDSAEA
jgi:hypothetical protein